MALKKQASSDGEEDEVLDDPGEEKAEQEKGADPEAGDPQMRTLGAPVNMSAQGAPAPGMTQRAPLAWGQGGGAPQGMPNWAALQQRMGGVPPQAQTGPGPGNVPAMGMGGMMGGGGGWLHQLAQRLAQRRQAMQGMWGGGGGIGQGAGGAGPRPGGMPGLRR